jgi:hypothetical protein
MSKILAKYARRNNSDELPDRRELVEMDLFDTDRNPWPGKLGGSGLWERYDFDHEVPLYPTVVASGDTPIPSVLSTLDVKRTSLVVVFVNAVYVVESGSGAGKTLGLSLEADGDGGYVRAAIDGTPLDTEDTTFATGGYEAFGIGVLNKANYTVRLRAWISNEGDPPNPVVKISDLAASILVLPAGQAALGTGWGGTGG